MRINKCWRGDIIMIHVFIGFCLHVIGLVTNFIAWSLVVGLLDHVEFFLIDMGIEYFFLDMGGDFLCKNILDIVAVMCSTGYKGSYRTVFMQTIMFSTWYMVSCRTVILLMLAMIFPVLVLSFEMLLFICETYPVGSCRMIL